MVLETNKFWVKTALVKRIPVDKVIANEVLVEKVFL